MLYRRVVTLLLLAICTTSQVLYANDSCHEFIYLDFQGSHSEPLVLSQDLLDGFDSGSNVSNEDNLLQQFNSGIKVLYTDGVEYYIEAIKNGSVDDNYVVRGNYVSPLDVLISYGATEPQLDKLYRLGYSISNFGVAQLIDSKSPEQFVLMMNKYYAGDLNKVIIPMEAKSYSVANYILKKRGESFFRKVFSSNLFSVHTLSNSLFSGDLLDLSALESGKEVLKNLIDVDQYIEKYDNQRAKSLEDLEYRKSYKEYILYNECETNNIVFSSNSVITNAPPISDILDEIKNANLAPENIKFKDLEEADLSLFAEEYVLFTLRSKENAKLKYKFIGELEDLSPDMIEKMLEDKETIYMLTSGISLHEKMFLIGKARHHELPYFDLERLAYFLVFREGVTFENEKYLNLIESATVLQFSRNIEYYLSKYLLQKNISSSNYRVKTYPDSYSHYGFSIDDLVELYSL
ncbi:hypothetical protein CW735_03965 [Alteromonas sp. MB-3u-76]|nr:hypothetical protein CW735_03965 [Alteromonas sp. MB-3u-76]